MDTKISSVTNILDSIDQQKSISSLLTIIKELPQKEFNELLSLKDKFLYNVNHHYYEKFFG